MDMDTINATCFSSTFQFCFIQEDSVNTMSFSGNTFEDIHSWELSSTTDLKL